MPYLHICYASELIDPSPDVREAILLVSRRNNERAGITGCIAFDGPRCAQILEGEAAVVEALYETIRHDPRHGGLVELVRRPIEALNFDSWGMSRWRMADVYLLSERVAR